MLEVRASALPWCCAGGGHQHRCGHGEAGRLLARGPGAGSLQQAQLAQVLQMAYTAADEVASKGLQFEEAASALLVGDGGFACLEVAQVLYILASVAIKQVKCAGKVTTGLVTSKTRMKPATTAGYVHVLLASALPWSCAGGGYQHRCGHGEAGRLLARVRGAGPLQQAQLAQVLQMDHTAADEVASKVGRLFA